MSSSLGTSVGTKTIGAVHGKDGGVQRVAQIGYLGTSSGNKVFFSALSVAITPGAFADSAPSTVNNFSTESYSRTGGIGPFTQVWSLTGTSGGTWSFLTGTTNTTCDVRVLGVSLGVTAVATLNLNVTDTATGIVAPASCILSFEHTP